MIRIIVAGTRTFDDYLLLKEKLDQLTKYLTNKDFIILSGNAQGADRLGELWATRNFVTYQVYRPDYQKYKPKIAPIMRNQEMVDNADILVAFWNGKSTGTKDIIERAVNESLQRVIVINYKE